MGHCRLLCAGLAPRAAGWRHRRIDAAQPPFSPPQVGRNQAELATCRTTAVRARGKSQPRSGDCGVGADEHEAQAQQPGPSRSNWNGAGPSNGAASGDRNPPRHRSGGDSEDAENHSLIQIQTYSSFLLCPSSVLFIFTLHLCVCLPALLTCSGALRTRPSAGRGTRLVRTGTALASAAIARPDQRRRRRWRLQRHLSPSGRWIF